jgi:hypothetical protein
MAKRYIVARRAAARIEHELLTARLDQGVHPEAIITEVGAPVPRRVTFRFCAPPVTGKKKSNSDTAVQQIIKPFRIIDFSPPFLVV